MSRKRGKVDTAEYIRMVVRIIRALARRVGNADPEDLAAMLAASAELDAAIAAAARRQHEQGRSWAEIGAAAGISKQSAWERWGQRYDLTPVQELVLELAAR